MKLIADMSNDDITHYMSLMGRATAEVVPPDAMFCLIVFDPKQKAHYVSNARRLEIPKALRELADSLEAEMSKTN
jgi:hypothetical protein